MAYKVLKGVFYGLGITYYSACIAQDFKEFRIKRRREKDFKLIDKNIRILDNVLKIYDKDVEAN